MKYAFIKKHAGEFSVSLMCLLFTVSRSGYYSWAQRAPSKRELANRQLDVKIRASYASHKKRYGAPRITKELQIQGEKCGVKRVARRMKDMELTAIAKRKHKVTTDSNHTLPIFSNVLKRDFASTRPNQKWVGDITYIPTQAGWLYLAVIIDLYSRAVVGWSMHERIRKDLVCQALHMALCKKRFPQGVIMHTDRGSQYASHDYRKLLKNYRLIGSMSRKGDCWDNAVAESFFHTLKVELVHNQCYKTREMAKQSIFQYIEGYYNRYRRHSAIGYKTPFEMECACET